VGSVADAVLVRIEWSEAEVLKSAGVGTEAEVEVGAEQRLGRAFEKAVRRKPLARGKENRWWKTAGFRARSRDQVRSGADGGGAR
jgi:hypothetical protein